MEKGRMVTKRWRVITAVVVLAALGAVPVEANEFGGPGPGNYAANNGIHEVYRSIYLSVNMRTATDYVVTSVYDLHSDVTAYVSATYSDTINDVQVYEGNYGNTDWYAGAPCSPNASFGGSGDAEYCKPRYVRYNTGGHPGAFDTQDERRHFACHEMGHTLGLFHDSVGCVHDGGVSYSVGTHNWSHLYFY